jgi:hypothetical protein
MEEIWQILVNTKKLGYSAWQSNDGQKEYKRHTFIFSNICDMRLANCWAQLHRDREDYQNYFEN